LGEFASVVDVVNCAVKIQEEIKGSNTDTAENRRMEFRIGISLGDVIDEEDPFLGMRLKRILINNKEQFQEQNYRKQMIVKRLKLKLFM
jgi:hypothetical protein